MTHAGEGDHPGWTAGHPNVSWSEVPDVNHYTVTPGAGGAAAIASAVRAVT